MDMSNKADDEHQHSKENNLFPSIGSGDQGQLSDQKSPHTLADSGTQESGNTPSEIGSGDQGQLSDQKSPHTLADSGTQESGNTPSEIGSGDQGQLSDQKSPHTLADSGTQESGNTPSEIGSGDQGQLSDQKSPHTLADSGTQESGNTPSEISKGQGQDSEGNNQHTPNISATQMPRCQGEEVAEKNRESRSKSQVEQLPVIKNYCEFLELIFKRENYRFGLIMHTSVTIAVILGWSIILQPAKDFIFYGVLKHPRPLELDALRVTQFMEQYNPNSECDMTELQTKYTELQKNYSSLQKYVDSLQQKAADFNKTLEYHTKQIEDTNLSVKNISSNVTDVKGQLHHQSEQTHRVQRDIDQTMLKQISEESWKYFTIVVAIAEVCLAVYVYNLSLLRESGRQPQAGVQPTKSIDKQHTNGFEDRPRSVLNGISKQSTENSVCILSFNKDPAHTKHVKVSMSFLSKKVKVTKCIIYREEDILNVPPSKVVLVHVDFNSRNIILENPEREIGELKRKTVLALWKMSADVILLYHYEERNAKPLGEQDLYSSELVSVKTQTELKQLEEQQRFISLNGQLSARQRQHLSRLVEMRIG